MQNKLSGLSSAKKAVLFDLLRKKSQAEGSTHRIEPREDRLAPLPLSFSQLRLWFLDRLYPGDPVYNLPTATRILGTLHLPSLALALAAVADRHEALRTTFAVTADGEPVQVIAPRFVPRLPVVDLGALPAARRDPEIRWMSALESRLPFDLETGPLLRACVFRCADDEHLLLLEMHHIVSDGWSMGVLVNEIGALYPAFLAGRPSPLPELAVQYPDFAVWQRRRLSGALLEAELGWWRGRLAGMPPVLELPADHPRQAAHSTRGDVRTFLMPPAALAELQVLARRQEATLFMTLLAGFFAVLQRYTGADDLAVATPIAGRTRPELGPLIGFFVNTLVLRTDLGGHPSFGDLLARVRETTLSSFSHQELPFERLVEELAPERDLSRPPLVQVMFTLENAPKGALDHPGIRIIPEANSLEVAQFELTCTFREIEEGLFGMLDYSRELFEGSTMVRLGGHLERLLSGVLAEPQRPLAEIALLARGERHQLLAEWNDTAVGFPRGLTLHELVAAQAERTPGAVAAVDEDEQVTYRELVDRARQLAGHLVSLGVQPDGRVGVLLERSLAMITGLLGVLEAGAAYVPLDPTLPGERLATLAENAGLAAVVTQDRFAALLPAGGPPVVRFDAPFSFVGEGLAPSRAGGGAGGEDGALAGVAAADEKNLAYVLYTSGSTGTPKGVMIPHQGIVNRLQWMQDAYGLTAEDRVLQKTPFGFDVSVWEFFGPLLAGARLVFAQPEGHKDPRYLADLIARQEITVVDFVPSMLEVFLETPGLEALASLRRVLAGGEALPPQLVRRFFSRLPQAELYNLYGPTEASIDVSFWPCVPEPPGDVVPIGRPIANHQLHVVDRTLALQPVGVAGELLLGGPGLARGYLGRPDLTAAAFIPDPFGAGAGGRLYRTGDLVRRLADGTVHFLGRIDHQVKIRGFRIELGEIEAALTRLPGVREAVVLVREDATGDKRLAAYVVSSEASAPEDLRTALRRTLPEAMVPAEVMVLPSLPLNANGKVDRRALAKMAPAAVGSLAKAVERFLAPQGPVEEVLAQIWTEVLGGERRGLKRIGAQDDFFTLGGHSLLATQVMSRVRDAFRVELPLRAFFEAPTVTALAARIDGERRGEPARPSSIRPVPREGDLPLSFAQQRLWFLDRLAPDNPFYNMFDAFRLTGGLDLDALRGAFREIVRRHEALRTTFQPGEHGLVQEIAPPPSFAVPLVDLEGVAADLRRRELARLAGDEARRPFNLERGPLVRAALLRIAAEEHTLLVNLHHIISDGWSMGILFHELATLYGAFRQGAPSPLPELPIQYADFAVWQREWLSGERLAARLDYWRRQLAGLPVSLEMPLDHPRPAIESFRGAIATFALPAELARALSALTRRRGATQSMTLLAGFTALLGRFAGSEDVAVGMAIANRTRREVEGLIGLFINTLVLRTDLSGTPGFAQLIGRVRETSLASYAHQDLPFERLVEELQPERSLSRNPLIQVMFGYQSFPRAEAEVSGLTLSPPEEGQVAGGTAKLDLSLFFFESGGQLTGALEYNREIFEAATMLRLLRCFENLLAAAVADPEAPVAFLPLLGAAERHQLLAEWNDTAVGYPRGHTLHDLVAAQAERAPGAVAAVDENEQVTYRELVDRARRLAGHLARLGVQPDGRVGVLLERSLAMITGLLGVLEAGAAYVPLDPTLPEERLATLAGNAGLAAVITQDRFAALLPVGGPPVLSLDSPLSSVGERLAAASEQNLAYVLYTSGSTGTPKGVMIPHQGIVNRLQWMQEAYGLTAEDRVLQKTPFGFDVSVWEFFWPLLTGARLVFAQPEGHKDPRYLADLIAREKITTVHFVPSMLEVFLETPGLEALASLRRVVASGEALPPQLVRRFFSRLPQAELHNLYGPTEASVDVSFWPCVPEPPGDVVPIGRPIANHQLHVVDRSLAPQPVGVPGELLLGGPGLARGYLGRPDLTAAVFIPDPFGAGAGGRLYRTGDLVRRLADGTVHYLGRLDHQVKIRGFRIELGEIEAALTRLPGVREAVVLVREDATGDKRLAAYISNIANTGTAPEPALGPEDLRTALRRMLPEAMVPAEVTVLPSLPLNANGKVDRRALAQMGPAAVGSPAKTAARFLAPQGPVEEVLAQIWTEVLGGEWRGWERIGALDDFFTLGGHSLLATQVMSRVREAFGVELPLRAFFEASTVAALAARIDGERRGEHAQPSPILPVPRDRELPLSFAQQRLWFLDRLTPDNPFYNMYGAVRLTGGLDLDALRGAFREIVRRHEALRTTFQPGEHGPVQGIAPAPSFEVPLVDLAGLAADLRRRELARLAGDEARRPFNLARGPLVRAALLRIAAEEHTLLVNLHHIISDGWSMGILFHELATLYGAFSQGAPSPLPELPIQYADFAVWQREWLSGERLAAALDYWRRQLAGLPESLEMPLDHPRPAAESFRGATAAFALPAELARALSALTRRRGATQSMTLLAGFTALLGRFAGSEDVAVGMAIANRTRREVEGLIGFFVNTLVLRTDLSGTPGFAQLVGQVRETSLASYAHQDLPFERLVEELQPERSLSRNPLVQVMFGYQNFPRAEAEVRGLTLSPPEEGKVAGGTAKFDLSLFLFEDGDQLAGALEYNREIFEAATMLRLLRCFENLLAAAVAGPETPVAFLPLLGAAERHQLTREWNDSASDWPSTSGFQELFLEHVRRAPDAPAVIAGTASLSYADLNRRAEGLARALRRRGAGPGSCVGLCLERSAEMVVAVLAILQAGAAYVPLDPDYPSERLALMMDDCDLRLLVVDETTRGLLPQDLLAGRECLTPGETEEGEALATGGLEGQALAHVIYTSGSTGRPKGVALSQRAVVRLVRETNYVRLGPGDHVAQVSNLSFDAASYEIWGALLNGATLVVIPRDVVLSPPDFAAALSEHRITNMILTSALFARMAQEEPDAFAGLRELMVGGEAVDPEAARRVLAGRPPRRLLNVYGPAENTTYSSWYPIRTVPPGSLPIGSPVANTTLHVVDRWLQPVPLGVAGELAVGGQGLAWGYWRRPELTAERFVPDVWGPAGSRLYRTGDLVRRRADGPLEFLGRIDHQVKIRGFRIELGEIEARLAEHPAVRQTVVLAREDVPGDKRLAAYVVQNPAWETAGSGEQTEQVSQWGEIFDDIYGAEAPEADPTFNIIGWDSTYTGLPLPASEMEEWLDDTIRGIAALAPRRVLEIGCGTGMILFRIAPRCEAYTGIDVSGRALRYIESQLGRVGLSDGRVRLLRTPAHELDGLAAGSLDTVVVNSVAQYFPSADYLAEVVERVVELVRPGGAIFLGDLRSLPLLEAFHTSLELFQADPATPLSRLRQKVHARHMDKGELAIDPAFFTALRERLPKLGRIEIHLKHGRAHNELTGFRYQAVLRVGTGREEPARDGVLDWRRERMTLAALRRRLAEAAPQVVRLRNIPNARVAEDTAAVRLLQEAPEGIETAEDLRRRAAEAALGAVEPQDLWDLAKDLPYEVELSWADQGADGSFEATIRPSSGLGAGPKARVSSAQGNLLGGEGPLAAASLAAYANNPLQGRFARRIVPELRAFLEARLPAYMMPSAFVLLDALPITPNGKIDRRRLPAPGGSPESGRSLVAARNATEERLLAIWKELLGVERIGIEDDFFALGGHSLLATQAISRVRQAFGVELPLRTFFAAPSVASVASEISRLRLGGGEADVPPIVPVPRGGRLPLSFAQERLWFLDRLEARTLAYNEAAAFRLEGPLDIAAFRGALDEIVLRHESLRTTFPEVDGEAVQVIGPAAPFEIPGVDLRALPKDLHGEEIHRLALSQALRPFSLAHGPLMRGLLMRLGENDHAVLFSSHHIIFDGWSIGIFVRELSALYRARIAGAPASLPPLDIQYADFAAWQRGWLQGEVLERQVAWWRGQLTGAAVLELPTDRPRPILAQATSGLLHPLLRPALTEPLRAFSRGHGATLFMTLLAGFQALLHRHTGQTDISVGTPIANRNHGDVEKLIGFFINMLVLRTDLSGDPGFGDLVDRVRETALGAYDHQSVPFAKLVEELRPERDLRHTPLFQVSFQVLNLPQSPLELPGITLHPLSFAARSAKFDLDLALTDAADRLSGVLDYNADLFDATTLERFLAHLEQLLLGAIDNPARRLSELPLLTAGEWSQLAIEWNDTASAPPDPPCLHHWIARRIAEAPEALAAVCGDRRLTFGDLGRQSASLARRLREHGVGPEVPVVLFLDRSVEAIAGFVGILEAGGVYVPVDPAYPAERIAWTLEDCKAPVVVTTSGLAGRLPNGTPAVLLDELGGGASLPAAGEGRLHADHPAYVIYTSGSTGRPKGVVVRHGAVVNLARALRETVYCEEAREEAGPLRVGVNASFSFDGSIKQLVQLAWGHSLHILPQEVRLDPAALVDTVRRQRIDVLDCTPSQLRPLLAAGLGEGDAAPALVLVGGEAVDADLRDAALARSHQSRTRFWNVYGPTECTVDTAVAPFTAGAAPSRIGRPLPNVRVYTVTSVGGMGALAALGVPGELQIGGAGLARGYLGRPDLTAERFVPDPFSGGSGARLYRTGDLVRQLPDGSLDFLGRLDNQVKVRGYRIELGEIEAALSALPGVCEAVVVVKSDRLVAYVTGEADTAALRQALRDKLPDFMLPSAIVALPALPLTPSGKVDRKALPEPDSGPAPGFVAPRTAVEEVLAEIWAELLGVGHIGVHDNFFERGGHSLLAVLLMARIEKRLGKTLPLAALFSAPTLEALAALAETSGGHPAGRKGRGPLVAIKPEGDQIPFFCVHPVGGNVLCYVDLARHLAPDQPFYAFQIPDDRPPAKSIEEMAARYLAEVRRIQPQGPYRLGGWSMGGLVAFAMARQLATEGQTPELLALIDTLPPETATAPATDEELVAAFAQDMARLLGADVGVSPEELRSLPEQEKLAHVVRLGHTAGLLPADFGLAQIGPLFATFAANLQASRAYAPEPYTGRLTLWVSEQTAASYAAALDAWSRLVPAGLDRILLPGDHYSLLRRPEVERLARELTAQLRNDDGSTFAGRADTERPEGAVPLSAPPSTSIVKEHEPPGSTAMRIK